MLKMKGLLSLDERANAYAMLDAVRILNGTVNESKQGIVLTTADVSTRMNMSATLANKNRTGGYRLASESLATKTLTTGVAAVTGRAKTFFVCHVYTYFLQFSGDLLGYRSLDGSLGGSSGLTSTRGRLNLDDLQASKLLTMTLKATIALTLVELEDELLLALELFDDLSSDLSLCKLGRISDDLLAVIEEDNGEGDLGTDLTVDLLDVQDIIGGDLILLAAS